MAGSLGVPQVHGQRVPRVQFCMTEVLVVTSLPVMCYPIKHITESTAVNFRGKDSCSMGYVMALACNLGWAMGV